MSVTHQIIVASEYDFLIMKTIEKGSQPVKYETIMTNICTNMDVLVRVLELLISTWDETVIALTQNGTLFVAKCDVKYTAPSMYIEVLG